jgi:hypothetical protein
MLTPHLLQEKELATPISLKVNTFGMFDVAVLMSRRCPISGPSGRLEGP